MKPGSWLAAVAGSWMLAAASQATVASPVVVEVVGRDGRVFREFPVTTRDGALRSYLQAEKGEHYEVRVRKPQGVVGRVRRLTVDGVPVDGNVVPLAAPGTTTVVDAVVEP